MYQNQIDLRTPINRPMRPLPPNNRFVGGAVLAPFILGGITGGLLAPAFYPRPYYGQTPYYGPPVYNPYPPYYYRPY
ncbi:MAG: hypothetical protein RSB72_00525 [Bacilli bacterium]